MKIFYQLLTVTFGCMAAVLMGLSFLAWPVGTVAADEPGPINPCSGGIVLDEENSGAKSVAAHLAPLSAFLITPIRQNVANFASVRS